MNREPAKSFKDLIVWQKAHQLVLEVYRITKNFPKEELFALTSQFRRSAISVAANISEGFKKQSVTDKLRYLNISQDLKYGNTALAMEQVSEVGRLLESYIKAIRK